MKRRSSSPRAKRPSSFCSTWQRSIGQLAGCASAHRTVMQMNRCAEVHPTTYSKEIAMRSIRLVAITVIAMLALAQTARAADTYKGDPVHSSLIFKSTHLNGTSHVY